MTISTSGSISGSTALTRALTADGLSNAKASLVENDLAASVKDASAAGSKPLSQAVRSALNDRMAADVAAGKLTQGDVDAINKTLDAQGTASDGGASATSATGGTGSSSGTAAAKPAAGGGAGKAGGAGGSGSANKTELYETEVDTGAIATITIYYTDGSTATETEASSGTNASSSATSASDPASGAYPTDPTSAIPPGSIVDKAA